MYGNYSGGGNALEVCSEQTVYIWVYAHNTVSSKHNHSDKKTTGKLDFKGNAVSKIQPPPLTLLDLTNLFTEIGTQLQGRLMPLTPKLFPIKPSFTATAKKSPLVQKMYPPQPFKLGLTSQLTTTKTTKNIKAVEAFGSQYGISKSNKIFSSGALIGYNGNLPSCRYYAAYVQVAVKIQVKQAEVVEEEPPAEPVGAVPTEVTDTGIDSGLGNSWMLFAISATTATFVATYLRFAYARRRQQ